MTLKTLTAIAIAALIGAASPQAAAKKKAATHDAATHDAAAPGQATEATAGATAQPGDSLRYIFYFIGDGMGHGALTAADLYHREVLTHGQPLAMTTLPHGGMLWTRSASSPVTDSAAAGTALATGHKTRNYMLGMDADSIAVQSIAAHLHQRGWGVGLITTCAPDDATPGAFYSHVDNRRNFYSTACQALESGYEFFAGSSWRGSKDMEGKRTDIVERIKATPDILYTTDTDKASRSKRPRVMLHSARPFTRGNVGYVIDSIEGALFLPDMTVACIKHLQRYTPGRFFMMVEGGNIDHTSHSNDGPGSVMETVNFDQALRQALQFYNEHPRETLIIVTADHETGGMAVGTNGTGYTTYPRLWQHQRISKDRYSRHIKELLKTDTVPTWDNFKAWTTSLTGLWGPIEVSPGRDEQLHTLFNRTFIDREQLDERETLYATFNVLADEIFNTLNDAVGIGFVSINHSGNPVPLMAIGVGAEAFDGIHDNTYIYHTLRRLTGLDGE